MESGTRIDLGIQQAVPAFVPAAVDQAGRKAPDSPFLYSFHSQAPVLSVDGRPAHSW
jgi:hypothetical protein